MYLLICLGFLLSVSILVHLMLTRLAYGIVRLGHPSLQRLVLLQSLVPNVITCNINKTFDYSVCPLAKQKMLPFPSSISSSFSCFDLVHADIWGPYSTPSLNGSKYFLTLVDDYSRCTWVYLMKHFMLN